MMFLVSIIKKLNEQIVEKIVGILMSKKFIMTLIVFALVYYVSGKAVPYLNDYPEVQAFIIETHEKVDETFDMLTTIIADALEESENENNESNENKDGIDVNININVTFERAAMHVQPDNIHKKVGWFALLYSLCITGICSVKQEELDLYPALFSF